MGSQSAVPTGSPGIEGPGSPQPQASKFRPAAPSQGPATWLPQKSLERVHRPSGSTRGRQVYKLFGKAEWEMLSRPRGQRCLHVNFMDADGPWWLASPSAQRCEDAPCPQSMGGKGRLHALCTATGEPRRADLRPRCTLGAHSENKLCAHCTKINKMKIIIIIKNTFQS